MNIVVPKARTARQNNALPLLKVLAILLSTLFYLAYSGMTTSLFAQSPTPITVESSISSGSDDAQQNLVTTEVNLTSPELDWGQDGDAIQVGLIFRNVQIPASAKIESAVIEFTYAESSSERTRLTLRGIRENYPRTFDGTANNISNRPVTTAGYAWLTPRILQAGDKYRTPNFSAILEELIDPSTTFSKQLGFVIVGTGQHAVASYEGLVAPKLIISYIPFPTTPTLIAPSGTLITKPATFEWNDTEDATSYKLSLHDMSTYSLVHQQTYNTATICASTTCSVPTTGIRLNVGTTYRWSVRGVNTLGNGPSSTSFFKYTAVTLPARPTLIAPSGTLSAKPAAFKWNNSGDAASYDIYVRDTSTSSLVHQQTFAPATICASTTCSIPTTGITLNAGTTYQWSVRSANAVGVGRISTPLTFKYTAVTLPTQPTLIAPSSILSAKPATFEWNNSEDATSYEIYLYNITNEFVVHRQTYDAATLCNGTTCSLPTTDITLNSGRTYYWWIRGANAVGNGRWSRSLNFQIQETLSAAVQLDPADVQGKVHLPFIAGSNTIRALTDEQTPDDLYDSTLDPDQLYQ